MVVSCSRQRTVVREFVAECTDGNAKDERRFMG